MQHINLYRPPPKKPFEILGVSGMLLMVGLISVLLMILWAIKWQALWHYKASFLELQANQNRLSQEMSRLTQNLPKKEPDPALAADIQRLEQDLSYLPTLKARLEGQDIGNPEGFGSFLRALAQQTPEGLWLTHFQILQGGRQFTFKGNALAADRVPTFVQALGQAPAFANLEFDHMSLTRPTDGSHWVEFTLSNRTTASVPAKGRLNQ